MDGSVMDPKTERRLAIVESDIVDAKQTYRRMEFSMAKERIDQREHLKVLYEERRAIVEGK